MTRHLLRAVIAGSVCLLAGIGSTASAEADVQAGELRFNTCRGCHAIPGYTNAYPTFHVPRLAGQNPGYIVAALTAYQAGARAHETMKANASALSESDMADIAAYLGGLDLEARQAPITVGNPEAGAQLLKDTNRGLACASCHGENGGTTTTGEFPKLAGQYADYLKHSLEEYKSGARNNPIMSAQVQNLSEQDMADLAAFYAAQADGLATPD